MQWIQLCNFILENCDNKQSELSKTQSNSKIWGGIACFTGVIYKFTPKGYLNSFIFYVKNNIQLVEALPGFTS
jgi:hypothetical protein